jgi:hypothetical protein
VEVVVAVRCGLEVRVELGEQRLHGLGGQQPFDDDRCVGTKGLEHLGRIAVGVEADQ